MRPWAGQWAEGPPAQLLVLTGSDWVVSVYRVVYEGLLGLPECGHLGAEAAADAAGWSVQLVSLAVRPHDAGSRAAVQRPCRRPRLRPRYDIPLVFL